MIKHISQLDEAIKTVIGEATWESLRHSPGRTTLHDMAIVRAFTYGAPEETVAVLREAKIAISKTGFYPSEWFKE